MESCLVLPPNKRVQPTGWIGAILASRCSKIAVPIYQTSTPSRPLNANPLGAAMPYTLANVVE